MREVSEKPRLIEGILIFAAAYSVSTAVAVALTTSLPIRANTAVSAVVLAAVSLALLRLVVARPLHYVRLDRSEPSLIGYSVLASVAIILPTLSLEVVVAHHLEIPEEIIRALTDLLKADTLPELAYVWLVAAAGAALSEELLFRGILQNCLAARMQAWIAIVITSAVFGILHTIWRFPPSFILGVFLGMLYWRTRSLLPPLAAHLTINTVAIVIVFLAHMRGEASMPAWLTEERPAPIWIIVASLLAFVTLFRTIWIRTRPWNANQDSSKADAYDTPVTTE